jgi:hypothetical protein
VGDGVHGGVEGGPIFLNPRRGKEEVETQYAERQGRVLYREASIPDPDRSCCGSSKVQYRRFIVIYPAIGCPAIVSEDSAKDRNVRSREADCEVISKRPCLVKTPGQTNAREAKTQGRQKRFNGQIEKERGKRVPLAHTASDVDGGERLAFIHDVSMAGAGGVEKDRCE